MTSLYLHSSVFHELPTCIGLLQSLQTLNLTACSQLRRVPASVGQLTNLQSLIFTGCHELQHLPTSIGQLCSLHVLCLCDCNKLEELPNSIGQIGSLLELDLSGCGQLQKLPPSIGQLNSLQMLYFEGCAQLQELPASIGQLSSLQMLNLQGCQQLKHLPTAMGQLGQLKICTLTGCTGLQALPDLSSCPDLEIEIVDGGKRRGIGLRLKARLLRLLLPEPAGGDRIGPHMGMRWWHLLLPVRWYQWMQKASRELEGSHNGPFLTVPFDRLPLKMQQAHPDFVLDKAEALLEQSMAAIAWIAILLATASYVGFIQVPGETNSGGLVRVDDRMVETCEPNNKECIDDSTAMNLSALRSYFVCNVFTFFFSLGTALFCVVQNMPSASPPTAGSFIFTVISSAIFLLISIIAGACTFLSAVFAVYPQTSYTDMYGAVIPSGIFLLVIFATYIYRVVSLTLQWRRVDRQSKHPNIRVTSSADSSDKQLKNIFFELLAIRQSLQQRTESHAPTSSASAPFSASTSSPESAPSPASAPPPASAPHAASATSPASTPLAASATSAACAPPAASATSAASAPPASSTTSHASASLSASAPRSAS